MHRRAAVLGRRACNLLLQVQQKVAMAPLRGRKAMGTTHDSHDCQCSFTRPHSTLP